MIIINVPSTYSIERKYIIDVIFKQFLGLEYSIVFQDRKDISIEVEGIDNKELRLPDIFFQTPQEKWLTIESLPKLPLLNYIPSLANLDGNIVSSPVPMIYGERNDMDISKSNGLNIDILGSAFFMLTRYEEIVKSERDQYGRFPDSASLAYREGFFERPIINEYIEIFWAYLKRLWPSLERKNREFRLCITHDVDRPFAYYFLSPVELIRFLLGDFFVTHNLSLLLRNILKCQRVKMGRLDVDPFFTFKRIMDISEVNGLRSAFYFISSKGNYKYGGNYDIGHPKIRQLLHEINNRGHEIGFHANFCSYKSYERVKSELNIINKILAEEKIKQEVKGGRQHYLQWQAPITWQNWEVAGLEYDTSVGFSDHAGFRCGVCYEYPVFNLKTRQTLKLIERPLIVMDWYLESECGFENSLEKILVLKNRCRKFRGDFVLLWHNNRFVNNDIFINFYNNILNAR